MRMANLVEIDELDYRGEGDDTSQQEEEEEEVTQAQEVECVPSGRLGDGPSEERTVYTTN